MTRPALRPGDVLCYRSAGPIAWWIRVKTWSDINHVEIYIGDGVSVAARGSGGVGRFPLREDGLHRLLRPVDLPDLAGALAWFDREAIGQAYDFVGVVMSFYARWRGRRNRKMFCSELATRFLRRGGAVPVHPSYDADAVAPETMLASPSFEWL